MTRAWFFCTGAVVLVGAMIATLLAGVLTGNTVDPLPAPDHPLLFGYYYEDAARYGDFQAEVKGYTNLYIAIARSGYEKDSDATDEEWLANMRQALKRVAADGM